MILIVADTGPVNYLIQIGCIGLLAQFAEKTVLPATVQAEFGVELDREWLYLGIRRHLSNSAVTGKLEASRAIHDAFHAVFGILPCAMYCATSARGYGPKS